MSERNISLEVATDLAWVENEAYDAAEETSRSFSDALRLSHLGVELGTNALTSLRDDSASAEASLGYARKVVPDFRSEVVQPTSESLANTETLTPEEQTFKESLLGNFETSYGTYTSVLDAINSTKERRSQKNKLETATEAEAQTAVEALLTPGVVRHAMAEMKEFTDNPESNSPGVGFDVLLVPNANLAAEDEDAVAAHIQSQLTAYNGKDYKYEPLHNQDTAHKVDTATDSSTVAVLAPRHLNMRRGNVATQQAGLDQHNQSPEAETKFQTADDLTAMTHILALVTEKTIDVESKRSDASRFWATYYKDVTAQPVGGYVPLSCVLAGGQFSRGGSSVEYDNPSRALVVPKA